MGQRVFHDHDVPKEFWWAEGHEALEQDWATGDFSTWHEKRIEMKAFGVTFARADIEKMAPSSASNTQPENTEPVKEDEELIEKLDALVPSAALSYKQAIFDLKDNNRISFRAGVRYGSGAARA